MEDVADANNLSFPADKRIACLTQTTLSVDDTAEIMKALRRRFSDMLEPGHEDICYATTNRQEVVKLIAPQCDKFLVVGSVTSSNSLRLVEVARKAGCADARLIDSAEDIDYSVFQEGDVIGLSAGASAPEILVQGRYWYV